MKRIITLEILLVMAMIILVACGNKVKTDNDTANSGNAGVRKNRLEHQNNHLNLKMS